MCNLVKYVGIGLLVMGFVVCDNNDIKVLVESVVVESQVFGQFISLMDGKFSFLLLVDMID